LQKSPDAIPVPKAFRVQLARLFGGESVEARKESRTPAEWRRTLKRVLHELDRYTTTNVDTDEVHHFILAFGLCAADQALKNDDFWPGYVEGITQFALALLGDYPDHRRRKGGAKRAEHYGLDRCRSLRYIQNRNQRLNTLFAAGNMKLAGLSKPPREALDEFRMEHGFRVGYREFFQWYRKRYPADYAGIF